MVSQSNHSEIQHPLVEETRQAFQDCVPDENGILKKPKRKCLDLQVSPAALDRALSIMDLVLKGLEKLGHKVTITSNGTVAQISGTVIPLGIFEELKRKPLHPSEHELEGNYQFGFRLFSEHRAPAGILCLTSDPPPPIIARKNWKDSETKKLEDHVPSFMKVLLLIAGQKEESPANDE